MGLGPHRPCRGQPPGGAASAARTARLCAIGSGCAQIGELGAEADVSKTTGVVTGVGPDGRITTARTAHDAERDPGHYIDVDDAGYVLGGKVKLSELPATRQAYDTVQRQGTDPAGQTQYSAGYLPYAIIDGFQQVRKDFGLWRVLQVGYRTARTRNDRRWFRYQLELREELTLRDIGYYSHFVADGSQPMHLSVHYNGWGDYPNPNGYTTAPIHAPFEGAFVQDFVDFRKVAARIPGYRNCHCTIGQRVPQYLARMLAELVPVYEAAGTDHYTHPRPKELAVVTRQLAAGAAELRDQIIDAWRQSDTITVGYPLVQVKDVLAGRARVTRDTFGRD